MTDTEKAQAMIVGIAGGTGSGKTTLSGLILERVGRTQIAYMPHDAYYKDQRHLEISQRAKTNYDHPDSLETSLLVEHLKKLRTGQPVEMPVYDFTIHSRVDKTIHIEPRPVILVEGILIFVEPELRNMFDVKLYVDTDADLRFIRRLERDIVERGRTVESVIKQYMDTVRPMHLEFVENSKRYADIIIPEGGLNPVALDMVIARLQFLLNGELPVGSRT